MKKNETKIWVYADWQSLGGVMHILVSNTDDHLRNHGFILTNQGWRLSPAYDMNPNEMDNGHYKLF